MLLSLIAQLLDEIPKNARIKRNKCIAEGKVYYGFFRMLGLILLSLCSGDLVAMLIFEETVEGTSALLITLLFSIFSFLLYLLLYIKHYKKLSLSKIKEKNSIVENDGSAINISFEKSEDNRVKTQETIEIKNRRNVYFLMYFFLVLIHLGIIIPVVTTIYVTGANTNPLLILGTIVELVIFSIWLIKSIRAKKWEKLKKDVNIYEKDVKFEKNFGIIYYAIMTIFCGFGTIYFIKNIDSFDGEMIFILIVMTLATIYCGWGLVSTIKK